MPDHSFPLQTPASLADARAAGTSKPRVRRTRRRWWLLLFLTAIVSLGLSPAPWHVVLRSFLTLRAARQGWDLQIGAVDGGLFDAIELYDVRCRQRPTEEAGRTQPNPRTDFQIARAELVFAWRWLPMGAAQSWVNRLAIDGLRGTCDFTRPPSGEPSHSLARRADGTGGQQPAGTLVSRTLDRARQTLARRIQQLDHALLPANLEIDGQAFTLQRGRYQLHAEQWRFAALSGEVGHFAARRVEAIGPGFDSRLPQIAGWTYWKGSSLSIGDADLGRGVHLAHATLDGAHLKRQRLSWEGELRALGGSARGQGSIDLSRPRIALEIAGSLEKMAVRPLAKLLGARRETDGEVQQANFTFRGDPENWAAAEMWLAANATDFRWGQRRWESLEVQGVVMHRRVQVHRLELRQSRNQLSFTGEFGLPAADNIPAAASSTSTAASWWQSGFSCNIDARVDDLHALAQLAGPQLPEMAGRMSVNGTLRAHPGAPGIDGYLNVEGSALSIRGAPLTSLRTTLLFRGEELNIPDVEATSAGDYLRAKGSVRIIGPARYQAELHAAIKDLAVYAPAYADLPFSPAPIGGSLTLDWSGDGAPGAHSGAFVGSVEHFFTQGGPAALARPINLTADGTYSPESVSFRRLVLKEGAGGEQPRDVLTLEGALPWTRDPRAFAAGRWLDPERVMALRVECAEAPLELLASLAPQVVAGAGGQISGWLTANGTLRSPALEADFQLQNASLRPAGDATPVEDCNARVRVEKSVLRLDGARGRWGTQTLVATGSINLAETAHASLDLTVQGNDAAGVHNRAFAAGLSYAVTLRGELGSPMTLAGEINLLDGTYAEALPLRFDDFRAATWLEAAARLPFFEPGTAIALHLGAAPPLRMSAGGTNAELTPDLNFTGTVLAPRVAGELTFHNAPVSNPDGWRGTGDGVFVFSADQPGNPLISVSAHEPDGGELLLYGTVGDLERLSWPAAGSWNEVSESSSPADPIWVSADPSPTQYDEANSMASFAHLRL